MTLIPGSVAWEVARANKLEAERDSLLEAINDAYRILCSGKPPHSARETNARRVLRHAGAINEPTSK